MKDLQTLNDLLKVADYLLKVADYFVQQNKTMWSTLEYDAKEGNLYTQLCLWNGAEGAIQVFGEGGVSLGVVIKWDTIKELERLLELTKIFMEP